MDASRRLMRRSPSPQIRGALEESISMLDDTPPTPPTPPSPGNSLGSGDEDDDGDFVGPLADLVLEDTATYNW